MIFLNFCSDTHLPTRLAPTRPGSRPGSVPGPGYQLVWRAAWKPGIGGDQPEALEAPRPRYMEETGSLFWVLNHE